MYLLDTNTYSLFHRGELNVVRRYNQADESSIYLSDVTVSEVLKGRLKTVHGSPQKGGPVLVQAYTYLLQELEALKDMNIVHYSIEADRYFAAFTPQQLREGTNDCRIAAIAYVEGLTVVTANSRHFDAIGCKYEDWTLEAP